MHAHADALTLSPTPASSSACAGRTARRPRVHAWRDFTSLRAPSRPTYSWWGGWHTITFRSFLCRHRSLCMLGCGNSLLALLVLPMAAGFERCALCGFNSGRGQGRPPHAGGLACAAKLAFLTSAPGRACPTRPRTRTPLLRRPWYPRRRCPGTRGGARSRTAAASASPAPTFSSERDHKGWDLSPGDEEGGVLRAGRLLALWPNPNCRTHALNLCCPRLVLSQACAVSMLFCHKLVLCYPQVLLSHIMQGHPPRHRLWVQGPALPGDCDRHHLRARQKHDGRAVHVSVWLRRRREAGCVCSHTSFGTWGPPRPRARSM